MDQGVPELIDFGGCSINVSQPSVGLLDLEGLSNE